MRQFKIRKGMVFVRPFVNRRGIYGKFIITKERPMCGYWFEDRGGCYRRGYYESRTALDVRSIIKLNKLVLDKSSVIKLFFNEAD